MRTYTCNSIRQISYSVVYAFTCLKMKIIQPQIWTICKMKKYNKISKTYALQNNTSDYFFGFYYTIEN